MCMEDIRLARRTKYRVWSTATILNLPADPRRIAVQITLRDVAWGVPTQNEVSLSAKVPVVVEAASPLVRLLHAYQMISVNAVPEVIAMECKLTDLVTIEQIGQIITSELTLGYNGSNYGILIETYLDDM